MNNHENNPSAGTSKSPMNIGFGVAIGLVLGAGAGAAMNNIAAGMGAGLVLGIAIGTALPKLRKNA